MIRTIFSLALAGIALTPYADTGTPPTVLPYADVDPIQTSSMKTGSRTEYLASAASGRSCRIVVAVLGSGDAAASADANCAGVYPGLDTLAHWSSAGGNTVNLFTKSGTALLELGPSDGFAFEAVSPAAAQVTFSEI